VFVSDFFVAKIMSSDLIEREMRERLEMRYMEELEHIHIKRKGEWLASRASLEELTSELEYQKDEHGKPHIKTTETDYKYLSFSHTDGYGASALAYKPVGIDIELKNRDISRLQHKFSRSEEMVFGEKKEGLLRLWGAKEAIYKAYGLKKLDFRDNIAVDVSFVEKDVSAAKVLLPDKTYQFEVHFFEFEAVCGVIAFLH
jgi:phosphopantetheinyl transferase